MDNRRKNFYRFPTEDLTHAGLLTNKDIIFRINPFLMEILQKSHICILVEMES